MTGSLVLAGGFALACALAQSAVAQDARAGRDLAQTQCALCHGELGLATAPDAPNLAGENAAYIVEQLRAFRSGSRQHHQMSIIASGLTDANIADLAAWFDAIEVTATAPQLD